jgi:Tat protein translocase TatB subunit
VFGIGFAEILVILLVALIVFGPDRLPEMTRQAASFVRDLRRLVASARRDISVSAQDLGIDEEDLRTLRQLRNPKAFVRDKVLDGLDLDELGLDDPTAPAKGNGARGGAADRQGASRPSGAAAGAGAGAGPAGTPVADPAPPTAPEPSDLAYDPDTT